MKNFFFWKKKIDKKIFSCHISNQIIMNQEQEFLTSDNNARYCLFPIKHEKIWRAYKNHFNCMWSAEEIDFSIDKKQWETLPENTKFFLKNILAFFANSDSIVLENLVTNLCASITVPEARCFYAFQGMMENVHSEVYCQLIDNFISEEVEKEMLFKAMETIPCVKKKSDWALRWINDNKHDGKDLARKMYAFAIVEGIFFSGAFCSIFWLKEQGVMLNSICKANEWINRDEGLHTEFAILMYTYINNKLTEEEAHNIMRDAVKIEQEFICESLPVDLIGMTKKDMKAYIEYVADRLLSSFQYNIIYESKNPFVFMQKLNLDGKTNFFEARVSEYSIAQKDKNTDSFSCLDNLAELDF